MTRFSGASSAMHANDRSLTMVDLFCCAGATARLVSEAGSEELRYCSGELILTHFSGEPLAAHTIDHRLTMVDLFCCTGATARLVSEAGSEELSRVIASGREVLTRVLMAGDEVQPREWLRADSGSDSLSARVVAALAHFLSSGVQLPTAGYGPLHEHLMAGITHPVNRPGNP
ncbi:hypothetical protein, partial [Escherichia coli]|uniref:hypothetical protein n=1 Tax=Escherichia coli TaxID=562 RepID=UPI0021E7937F